MAGSDRWRYFSQSESSISVSIKPAGDSPQTEATPMRNYLHQFFCTISCQINCANRLKHDFLTFFQSVYSKSGLAAETLYLVRDILSINLL